MGLTERYRDPPARRLYPLGVVVRDQCTNGLGTSLVARPLNDTGINPLLGNPLYPNMNWVPANTSIASGNVDDIAEIVYTVADDCDTCGASRVFEQVCYRGALPPSDIGADWTAGWIADTAFAVEYGGALPPSSNWIIKQGVQGTQTWSGDSLYILRGKVSFPAGTALTIEAGTRVIGENASNGYLIINRGATIHAVGTAAEPIVMTSDLDPPERGGWGGLVMCGYAASNCDYNGCLAASDSCAGEGGDAGYYCGPNDCDSSGVLKYVRVQYSGITFITDNELNSFSWNGIGSKTDISYCQAFMGNDDSFEWFGGHANASHLVAMGQKDDGLDWQMGFRGTVQFAVVQLFTDVGDKGIEADNNEFGFGLGCRSNPLMANLTLVGPTDYAGTATYGIHLRRGTDAHIFNSIITNFPAHGFRVEHDESCARGAGPAADIFYCGKWVGVEEASSGPAIPKFMKVVPNPVQDRSRFFFRMPQAGRATLSVFDARGRLVDKVVDDGYAAGEHQVTWSPSKDLASGMYFYRLDTGDGNAAEVLHRVTGLSVVDDKYVFVRGLGERYSSTQVNGATLSSPEANKRVVPLDLFPSSLLDNVVVQKTQTPDQAGDFGGGVVNVSTCDFPGRRVLEFSLSSGMNSSTTGKDFQTYSGGGTDWLGFDDGTRDMPGLIMELAADSPVRLGGAFTPGGFSKEDIETMGESFNRVFEPETRSGRPGVNFSGAYGDEFRLFGRSLGFIASTSLNNSFKAYDFEERFFADENAEGGLETITDYRGHTSNFTTLWGSLLSASCRLAPAHTLRIESVYNRSSEDEVRQWQDLESRIKFGLLSTDKDRDLTTRRFAFLPPQGNHELDLTLSPEELLTDENIGSGRSELRIDEITQGTDSYRASQNILARYAMLDVPLHRKLRLVTGVRWEDAEQNVVTISNFDPEATPIESEVTTRDALPSANLTYAFHRDANFRLAYGKSLNRPDIRELSPQVWDDFQSQYAVTGNPDLERAQLHNYDLRLEYFPGLNELLAVSLFYKQLIDPIEYTIIGGEQPIFSPENSAENGELSGLELESRFGLGRLSNSLRTLGLSANVTLVDSKVKVDQIYEGIKKRPLQGQSDYVVNLGLFYGSKGGATGAALLYNVFGPRLSRVGVGRERRFRRRARPGTSRASSGSSSPGSRRSTSRGRRTSS